MVMQSWFSDALDYQTQNGPSPEEQAAEEERKRQEQAANPGAAFLGQQFAQPDYGPATQAQSQASQFLGNFQSGPNVAGPLADAIATPFTSVPYGLPSFQPTSGGGIASAPDSTSLANAAYQGYNQDIPVVSDFQRQYAVPFAGNVGAAAAGIADPFGIGHAVTNATGLPSPQETGRFAGQGVMPVTAGDFALNAALAGGPLEAVTGFPIDNIVTNARGAAEGAIRAALPPPQEAAQVYRLGVSPTALADLPPESQLLRSLGANQVSNPAGVRILGPGEALGPGEVERYFGGRLNGPIMPGLNVTPNPEDAAVFARMADVGQNRGILNRISDAIMPERNAGADIGAGIPPAGGFDPLRDIPPVDLGQGPQMLGGEAPAPGGRLYNAAEEPFRSAPINNVRGLDPYDTGADFGYNPAQPNYGGLPPRAATAAPVPAAGGRQEPLGSIIDRLDENPNAYNRVQLEAIAKDRGIDVSAAKSKTQIVDAFREANAPPLAGGGITPEARPAVAEAGVASPPPASTVGELQPVGTGQRHIDEMIKSGELPEQAAWMSSPNGQASAAQLGRMEEIIGRPLAPEETAAITRRLETPAYSPEGVAERAGIGQAPTRAQALEDAQQAFADRVQEQADRFRAGNRRDMTPTEYARMAEAERVAAGIKPEQVRAGVLDWLNLPRSLMTGMDLSFALRQMVVLAPSHPIEWAKSVGTGIRSALSEDYALAVARRIENSPFKGVHENLYIAPAAKGAGTIAQREEQYATALLDRIPILGAIYRPFERGNVAMINQFRADVADNFVKNALALKGETLGNISSATQRQINVYDNFINRATGRGTLGQLDKSAVPLGQVFFSLRNTIAKPQTLASLASKPFTPAWNQMVKDTAGFFALGATTLYLADSAGLKVGVDPRSSDFGKIRVGDTHIDIWGGWQQQARAVFQAVQGARGETNAVSSSGQASTKSPLQIALPWVGSRASPQAGLAGQALRALAENKADDGPILGGLRQMFPDYRAPGLNAGTAVNYLTPLSVQDTADAIKSEGIKGGLLAGPLSFFGVGMQTYPDTSNPRTAAVNSVMGKPENLSSLPPNVAAFLQDKSWNAATPKEQAAILAKLSPEERAAVEKGEQTLRDKKDIFQLNRDEARARAELADQQREALKPVADKLLNDWKTGAMPPAQAIDAIKRVESAADKAANFAGNIGPKLSESQAYQEKVKGFGGDKTDDQKEVDRIREIQGKYYGIYDDPRVTNPDGTKNWDKIEAAQKAIMDTLRKSDPGFATRVEFNLQKNPENDYELTKWISKIDDRLNTLGYYDVPTGSKTAFQRTHPDADALVSLKYGGPVHSEAAARILLTMAPERKGTLSFAK